MKELRTAVISLLPMLLFSPAIIVLRLISLSSRKKKGLRIKPLHEIGSTLFYLFLALVASQTVLPKIEHGAGGFRMLLDVMNPERINLIPLNKFSEVYQIYSIDGYAPYLAREVLGNIGIFLVIGFLLPTLWEKFNSLKSTVAYCFLLALGIELIQLLLPRATDIDDVLLAVAGGAVGHCLGMALARRRKEVVQFLRQ